MKKDICELTVLEREAVANVFTLVRDHMIAAYDTPRYITYICGNIITLRSRELPEDDLPYKQAQDIIDLRIYYDEPYALDTLSTTKTIRGWLCKKAGITNEQAYRVYTEPCLQYE